MYERFQEFRFFENGTFTDDEYRGTYKFIDGQFVLTYKEFSFWGETKSYNRLVSFDYQYYTQVLRTGIKVQGLNLTRICDGILIHPYKKDLDGNYI